MWVEFQVSRGRQRGRTDEARNIASIKDCESGIPDFPAATGVRGTISELKHQGKYGFIAFCGEEYHFHASDLTQGLSYDEINDGMEIEFDVLREATDLRCGQAKRIRKIGWGDHNDMEHGGHRGGDTGDEAGMRSPNSHHMPEGLTRRGRVSLFKQEGRFGFLSAAGTDYYFNESDLRGELTSTRVYEGMEVEFTVSHGETERASPRATNVRLIGHVTDWLSSVRATFIVGRISFVKTNSTYGFIRTPGGQEYYFSGSDLREGLIFSSLHEGMEVEFQVRNVGRGNKAAETMNVRPISNSRKSTYPAPACEPEGSASSRGSISFIKRDGDYGFIRSSNGRDYQFHESDLAGEINFREIRLGMEVEFQVLRDARPGRPGKAVCVCQANEPAQEALPDQRGVVYCLVPNLRCGFMSTEDGEEYQFTESDLMGGRKYEDVREGTKVTFQIRKKPGKKAGKAISVALLDE
jgi:cold shock CspA family protein